MEVTPGTLAALSTSFQTLFREGFMTVPPIWDKVAMKAPSKGRTEVYPWIGGMSQMREWIGPRAADKLKIYDFAIRNKHWEKTIEVDRDDIEDDQFGFYGTQVAQMGLIASQHPDLLTFSLFNLGFTTNGYDNKSFFATDHPMGTGGTGSNKGTAALSPDSLAAAITQMGTLTDDEGNYLQVVPKLLVVPPQLSLYARTLLNASVIASPTGPAGSNVLIPNPVQNAAELLVAPRLAAKPKNWYLLDTSQVIKPFILQVRKEAQFVAKTNLTDDNVFNTNKFRWGADWRGNAGYGVWQLAFGADVA